MTDLETRLRDGMARAVAEQLPPVGLLDAVQRRHRRRAVRLIATAAAVTLVVVAAAVGASRLTGRAHRSTSPATFPGGGRLLFAHDNELSWLYPDGHQVIVARGFSDATVQRQHLVAQREIGHHAAYFLMGLDGSARRMIVPPQRGHHRDVFRPSLSPNGRSVAYLLQMTGHHVTQLRLEVRRLDTGRVRDLGRTSGSFWWQSPTTLLATTPGGGSLDDVDVSSGDRTEYLSVTDPSLVAAYASARPSAGPPSFVAADGWQDGPGRGQLALSIASSTPRTEFAKPIEVLYDGNRVTHVYAPSTPQQLVASTWQPHGLLLLTTGAGDIPGWNTYTTTATSDALSRPLPYGQTGVVANPAGTVIAMQDDNDIAFAAVPRPTCQSIGHCLHVPTTFLSDRGDLLAWLP